MNVFDCFILLFGFVCVVDFVARDGTMHHMATKAACTNACMCDCFFFLGLDELRYLYNNLITAIPVDAFASLTSLITL